MNRSKIQMVDIDGTTLAVGDTVIEVTPPHRVVVIETMPTADNTIIDCTIDGLYNALPISIIKEHCRKQDSSGNSTLDGCEHKNWEVKE
jgi:hypothetical protein